MAETGSNLYPNNLVDVQVTYVDRAEALKAWRLRQYREPEMQGKPPMHGIVYMLYQNEVNQDDGMPLFVARGTVARTVNPGLVAALCPILRRSGGFRLPPDSPYKVGAVTATAGADEVRARVELRHPRGNHPADGIINLLGQIASELAVATYQTDNPDATNRVLVPRPSNPMPYDIFTNELNLFYLWKPELIQPTQFPIR